MASSDVQRKLTAILCADVAGYSRLMGADEEATVDTLTDYRKVFLSHIETHRGRVVDAKGDAILAEFPSVVDAVNSAVEVQRELGERNAELSDDRRMDFRIGINLGDVVVKDDVIYGDGINVAARLESLAEPGGICISRPVFDQVKSKLSLECEYLGERQVKNITEPVRAYQVLSRPGDAAHRVTKTKEAAGKKLYPDLPALPSIAVLAFDNMSADADQEYFSDGISEDIITDLSKLSGLFVIARNSSFSYKKRNVPVHQIGREMGVRFVLEGSVRRAANRVRISAQLVEAQTGNHLWAERYDRDMSDIFTVQDEITGEIVTALDVALVRGEQARIWRKSLKNTRSRDLYYRGRDLWHTQTKEGIEQARRLYEQVIQIEPDSPLGYAQTAWSLWAEILLGFSENPPQTLARAVEFANKALARDDSCGEAHGILGALHLFQRSFDKALAEGERAVSLCPNSADVIHNLAFILMFAGRVESAIATEERAIRMCPVCPAFFYNILGVSYREAGRFDEAIEVLRKGVALEAEMVTVRFALISVYCAAERYEEARALHQEILSIEFNFSLEEYARRLPFKDPEVNERILAHLRNAGLA